MIYFLVSLLTILNVTKLSYTKCYSGNMENHIRMISRKDWLALPQERDDAPDIDHPVEKIVILSTKTDNCYTEVCLFKLFLKI